MEMMEKVERKRNKGIRGRGRRFKEECGRSLGEDKSGENKSRGNKENRSRKGKQKKDDNCEGKERGRKKKIMQNKVKLRGGERIWIEDDLTWEERKIRWHYDR